MEDVSSDDIEMADYNLLFGSNKEDTYGYFDIYFLKTKDDGKIYITEVAYEFEFI